MNYREHALHFSFCGICVCFLYRIPPVCVLINCKPQLNCSCYSSQDGWNENLLAAGRRRFKATDIWFIHIFSAQVSITCPEFSAIRASTNSSRLNVSDCDETHCFSEKTNKQKKTPWFALRTGHEHYTCLLYKSNKNSPGQHVRQHSQQRTVFLRSKTTMLKMLLTDDEWAQGTKDFIVVCFCVFFLILENLKSGLISPSSGRKCVCLSTWLK